MRGFRRLVVLSTTLSSLALVSSQSAADTDVSKPASSVFFGSVGASSSSAFGSVGFKTAISRRLDDPGWFVMGSLGAGIYRYRTGSVPGGEVIGRPTQTSILLGQQWTFGRTIIGLFVGPEYQYHALDPVDPDNRQRGGRFGLRGQAEIWSHPTDATLVNGTVVAGTTGHVWARLAAGLKIDDLYVGPEVTAYAAATYNETRLGAHATGIVLGPVTLRLSGGVIFTGDGETGAYAGLAGHVKY